MLSLANPAACEALLRSKTTGNTRVVSVHPMESAAGLIKKFGKDWFLLEISMIRGMDMDQKRCRVWAY